MGDVVRDPAHAIDKRLQLIQHTVEGFGRVIDVVAGNP
jgi:hypothetical protein